MTPFEQRLHELSARAAVQVERQERRPHTRQLPRWRYAWVPALLLLFALAGHVVRPRPPLPQRQSAAVLVGLDNELLVLDREGDRQRIAVPGRLAALAALPDGARAYVLLEGSPTLLVLDAVRLTWLDPLRLPLAARSLRVASGGTRLVIGEKLVVGIPSEHLPWTPTARCEHILTETPGPALEGTREWVANGTRLELREAGTGRVLTSHMLPAEPRGVASLPAWSEPLQP